MFRAGLTTSREPGRVIVVEVPGGTAHVPVVSLDKLMVSAIAAEVPETVLQFVALLMVAVLTPAKDAPKMLAVGTADGVMVIVSPAVRAEPEVYTMARDVGVTAATAVLGVAEVKVSAAEATVVYAGNDA